MVGVVFYSNARPSNRWSEARHETTRPTTKLGVPTAKFCVFELGYMAMLTSLVKLDVRLPSRHAQFSPFLFSIAVVRVSVPYNGQVSIGFGTLNVFFFLPPQILCAAPDAAVNYPCFHGGETPLMAACTQGHLG